MKLKIIEYHLDQIKNILYFGVNNLSNFIDNDPYYKYKEEFKNNEDFIFKLYEVAKLNYICDIEYSISNIIELNKNCNDKFKDENISKILYGLSRQIIQTFIHTQIYFVFDIFYTFYEITKFTKNENSAHFSNKILFIDDNKNYFNKYNEEIYIINRTYATVSPLLDPSCYVRDYKNDILYYYAIIKYLFINTIGCYLNIDDNPIFLLNSSNEKLVKFNHNCDTIEDYIAQMLYYNGYLDKNIKEINDNNIKCYVLL